MKYSEIVKLYSALEATTKKLEKRDILSNFLKEVPVGLLPTVVILSMGRVFPAWKETELGIAENIMIKTISKITGISETKVKEQVRKAGDMGIAVKNLLGKKSQTTLFKKELTVEKVFKNLNKIPTVAGSGSIDKKIALLSELLTSATPEEGKYITRTVLEELRIGVGEGIVRDAIAKAFNVPPDVVETAYSVRNDFGEIAQIAKEKGVEGLKKLDLKLGRPIKPMLAQKVQTIEEGLKDMGGIAAFEYKYDGMRAQIHFDHGKVTVFTRRLDNVTKQFPEIVEYAKECIDAENCIIEGEAVGIDPKTGRPQPFQRLSQRIKRKYGIKEMMKEIPVEVNLFDIMYLNNENYVKKPFEERRKTLERIIKVIPRKFQLAVQIVSSDPKEVSKFYKKSLSLGHEGIMIKNLKSPYTPGSRVKHMYKLKPEKETLDLVIIGAIWGEGRRSKWLGSFILGARDSDTNQFVEVGKVATGLTDKNLEDLTNTLKPLIVEEHIKEVKLKPELVVEVGYEEIQKSPTYESGFALRFPRVRRIRDDKGPEDADDLERISILYEAQKGKK